jgi:hypothetical protein
MVQLQLASERLREAQAMANDHKPLLAENSLRAFRITINDAAASLNNPANPQAARAAVQALRVDLAAVEQANSSRADDDAEVKQLVLAATDELDRIDQSEGLTTQPTSAVGEHAATPEATPEVTPAPTPQPVLRPTPSPKPSDGDRDKSSVEH